MTDRPDIVILLSDEERAAPPYEGEALAAWRRDHLAAERWFAEHGVSFARHYTGSLACVPSRPTLFTGQYPDLHGVTQTRPGVPVGIEQPERDDPEHMQAWLLRIARNGCLDQLRRSRVRGPMLPIQEHSMVCWRTPEDHAGEAEQIRIVRRAVAALPRRLRDVLVMREYGELSHGEIGQALGIGQAAVRSRLHRARLAVLRRFHEAQRAAAPSGRVA